MYHDLVVYKKAYQLALEIHSESLGFPKYEQYGGMADQLRRSSKSVVANLVEASSYSTDYPRREFSQIIQSIGSKDETVLWLKLSKDLAYMKNTDDYIERYEEIGRMLYGLKESRKHGRENL